MMKEAFLKLLWSLDEGEEGLRYTIDGHDMVTLSLIAYESPRGEDKSYSIYLLRVQRDVEFAGSYILRTVSDSKGNVIETHMENHIGLEVESSTLDSILEMLKESSDVYLNTFKIKDWDDYKELCLITD